MKNLHTLLTNLTDFSEKVIKEIFGYICLSMGYFAKFWAILPNFEL
jgi:hypothetical protein